VLFNSLTFVIFFIVVLLLHNAPFSWRVKKTNLLIGSYIFYAAWNPPFVILLWLSTVVLVRGPTVETTLKEADKLEAELIVVGTHGHGAVYDVLVGSYSAGIIRKSTLPVLVVPIREK
jgi:D-alanyl-lipoteichoic acid acyltransferase DltB (MBOAT superfamily)